MPVVDIDSHFEPTLRWLDDFPALKERLPTRYPTEDSQGQFNPPLCVSASPSTSRSRTRSGRPSFL